MNMFVILKNTKIYEVYYPCKALYMQYYNNIILLLGLLVSAGFYPIPLSFSVITSSSGSCAFVLLVILECCVTWMWTSVKSLLAYMRASVSTRPEASSASAGLDTQVPTLPSGDMKIDLRV